MLRRDNADSFHRRDRQRRQNAQLWRQVKWDQTAYINPRLNTDAVSVWVHGYVLLLDSLT